MNLDCYCNFCGNEKTFCRYYGRQLKHPQIKRYCENCGKVDSLNFKYSDFDDISKFKEIHAEDKAIYFNKLYGKIIEMKESDRKQYYRNHYLKSDYWRLKRERILERDNHKCRFCKSEGSDVHHISYRNLMREKWHELITLCRSCHEKCHSGNDFMVNGLNVSFGELKICIFKRSSKCKTYFNGEEKFICPPCLDETNKLKDENNV